MTKAFIFDLDGTLLDSLRVWDNLGSAYLSLKGVKNIPENLSEILETMSLWEAAEYFIAEFGLRLSPQQICDEINELLDNEYKHQVRLKDGVLDFLRRHEGTKMCIATETDKQLVEYALQRLGIEKYFDFVVTSADVGSSKKSPDIFIRAAERLGVRIDEAVVFEDALHAIRSAKSAGFYVIGVYEASHKEEENEIKSIADKYIYHFRDCEV